MYSWAATSKLVLMLFIVVYLFNGKVKYEKMLEQDSDMSSKATGPIVTKFHVEPPRAEGTKICSNSPDDITNMDLYGKNLKKEFFFSGTITWKLFN